MKSMFYLQDDSGPSATDVSLQFVTESDTQMVVHVQPVSSASRRNLLAPARPIAAPARPLAAPARPVAAPARQVAAPARPVAAPAAAPGYNFVWRNFRGVEENPNAEKNFVGDTGPSRQANAANSVTEHFRLFIDHNVIHSFCLETNRYANQNGVAGFQAVELEEMMAFIAMNIAMGIVNTSDVKDFWSTDPILSHPWFPSVMSRDRFLQIVYCLHLNNNQNDPGNDKLFKVRPLLDHIVRQCKKHYKPNCEVSIDEQMIGTKSRISFRQYMPMKPTAKWGIKVWVMADAVSGYCCNLQIYTGKEGNNVEKGFASRVVKDLIENYQRVGHHLYIDNFYTFPQLFKDLLDNGTLACGTIRSNRKGFPVAVKDNVDQNDSLFLKANMTEGFMTAVHWKDKRDVFALSTIHGNAVGDDIPHKPELICEYNKYMGGVDHNDQLLVYFAISHVLNEQGTGYEHIFSSVQTFNIDSIEKWGTSSERVVNSPNLTVIGLNPKAWYTWYGLEGQASSNPY